VQGIQKPPSSPFLPHVYSVRLDLHGDGPACTALLAHPIATPLLWAVLTFKTQQTSSPQYLNQHISLRTSACNTRSSSVPLQYVPFRRTSFARRSFSTAAPLTWNSLPPAVFNCDSLSIFKSRLICFLPLSANYSTYLFRQRLCSRLTALWRYINFVLLLLLLQSEALTPGEESNVGLSHLLAWPLSHSHITVC